MWHRRPRWWILGVGHGYLKSPHSRGRLCHTAQTLFSMTTNRITLIGAIAAISGAAIHALIPHLLPLVLDYGFVFSILLLVEDFGQILAVAGALLCAYAFARGWRNGKRSMLILAAVGILAGLSTLVTSILALLLGIAMGSGGGIPR